ncbi:MAG TPA: hypothetical protein ACFCUY_14095 [Xenococcaceae cyanobacterium]
MMSFFTPYNFCPVLRDNLVKNKIVNNWESQDEPEHFRTIRDRLLRQENLAGQPRKKQTDKKYKET